MGCNCKNKVNAINSKYGDGAEGTSSDTGLLMRIMVFLSRICLGIICFAIIIVMFIPMLLYVVACIMFGKEANFKIRDYRSILNKK